MINESIVTESDTKDICGEWIEKVNMTGAKMTDDLELEYLKLCIGPQRIPANVLYPLTIVYIMMGITGITGNVMVCAVIFRNISMRTSTNLFIFILASSDIATLLMGLTFDLSVYWHQYPWQLGEGTCKVRAFVSEMSQYCSVLTILAFSCERYLAICHPIYAYTMAGIKRTCKIILIIFFVSAIAACPFAVLTKLNYKRDPFKNIEMRQSAFCGMLETHSPLLEMSSLIFFLLPFLIMMYLYICMSVRIRKASNIILGYCRDEGNKRHKNKKSILKMLAVVVFCFFLCWAPFHTQRLLYVLHDNYSWITDEFYYAINEKLYYITGMFFYLNSTINPIIYNVMSEKYRKAFHVTFCRNSIRQSELSTRTNIDGSLISKSTIKNPNNPLEMSFMKNSPSPSSIRHPSSCPAVLQGS